MYFELQGREHRMIPRLRFSPCIYDSCSIRSFMHVSAPLRPDDWICYGTQLCTVRNVGLARVYSPGVALGQALFASGLRFCSPFGWNTGDAPEPAPNRSGKYNTTHEKLLARLDYFVLFFKARPPATRSKPHRSTTKTALSKRETAVRKVLEAVCFFSGFLMLDYSCRSVES